MLESPKSLQDYLGKTMEDNTMDNQQAKSLDLAWLAGLLDGEGSYYLSQGYQWVNHQRCLPKNGAGFYPCMKVTMCDEGTINKIRAILDTLVVGHYGIDHRPTKGTRKEHWGTRVTGMRRCLKLFEAVESYAVTKQPQIRVLKEYSLSRLSHNHRDPLTEREAEIVDIFRNPDSPQRLNARRNNRNS